MQIHFQKGLLIGLTKLKPEAAQEAGPALDYLAETIQKYRLSGTCTVHTEVMMPFHNIHSQHRLMMD